MIERLEPFRSSEYTGENRCWPCTTVNVAALALLVGAVARRRRRLAAAIAVLGSAVVWFRGHLVPYTPRYAPRLAAALPIDPFHGGDGVDAGRGSTSDSLSDAAIARSGADEGASPPSGEALLTELVDAGVVVPDGDDLVLDESVRADWRREMADLRRRDLEALAAVADDLTPAGVEARTTRVGGTPLLVLDGDGSGLVSLREEVAVAELAAARALESSVDDPVVRLAAGRPLRTFLERCPLCDGELTVTRTLCCGEAAGVRGTPPEKLVCPACDVRPFTYGRVDDGDAS
ncbi:hypothetical protein ACFQGT_11925 [Natrialbaceae archaeon GCM10025810]|uniref:hypothetical protein n=1 Tax=Halovalidus salilacus TaxID=3075124 RepID=UPI00361319B9